MPSARASRAGAATSSWCGATRCCRTPRRGCALAAFAAPRPAPTFPSFRPTPSLDRIMADLPGLVAELAVHDTPLARRASDHLALTVRVAAEMLAPGVHG